MYNIIREFFEKNKSAEVFSRVDSKHPLDIYIGHDENNKSTLLIVSKFKPSLLNSSNMIDIFIGKRNDGLWAMSLSLNNEKLMDIFCNLCNDIIESSSYIENDKEGIVFVCSRYEQWQKMLKVKGSELLQMHQIKGILGELMFLNNILIPKCGQHNALLSWLGPDMLPQDFLYDDKWYEIKAISSNADSVQISSLEQLDSNLKGNLVVVNLDKTSKTYNQEIDINSYVKKILDSIDNADDKVFLSKKLFGLGYYYNEGYDDYVFKFSKATFYNVDNRFPCLRKNDIPSSITGVKYTISIASIDEYIMEVFENWN